jgi:DNA polymerase-1
LPPPGEEEETRRQTLCGYRGKEMAELLVAADWPFPYAATHAVLCRHPSSRSPSPKQADICARKFLDRTIQAVAPKMICCFGSIALVAMIPGASNVTKARRRVNFVEREVRDRHRTGVLKRQRIPVVATYSPGQLYRQPHLRQVVIEDLVQFQRVFHGKGMVSDKRDRLYLLQGRDEDLGAFAAAPVQLSVDLETTTRSPWSSGARVICAAVSHQPLHASSFTLQNDPVRKRFKRMLARKQTRIVGHNLLFDLTWLTKEGYKIRGPIFDTLVAFHLLAESYPDKSLAHLARLYLPAMAGYEGEMKGERGNFTEATDELLEYCAADADAAGRLAPLFRMRLSKEGLLNPFRLRMRALKALVRIQVAGMAIDADYLDQLAETNRDLRRRLKRWFHRKVGPSFNPDSPSQVRRVLFRDMGIRSSGRTDTGKPSTREGSLRRIHIRLEAEGKRKSDPYRFVTRMLQWRESAQLEKLYFKPYREDHIKADGRIHPFFSMSITATGRLASSKPNTQQVAPVVRTAFRSRFEGGSIIKIDQSQIELRVLAHFSEEPSMLQVFVEEGDIHTRTAGEIYGIPDRKVSTEQRQLAKKVNFGIVYGMNEKRLVAETGMPFREAQRFLAKFWDRLPLVKEWIYEQKRMARLKGYTKSLFGVKRRFIIDDPHTREGQAAFREAVNHPIQSSASDINLVALIEMDYHLLGMKSCLINTTHDDILIDAHPDELDEILILGSEVCERPPLGRYGVKLSVPLKADVSFGPSWGEQRAVV